MKIEAVTLREIHMPLVHFFETSFGRTYSRRILLVTVHCEGVAGWGECVVGEDPYYSSEWIESAWPTLTHYLIPSLLGKRIESGRECPALLSKVRGHRMAKAGLENALWEAEAIEKKLPLWKLLGGTRSEIPCGVSIGIQDSVEQLLDKIQTELAAGYRRIKIKVKPGWDVNVLERIRSRWADITLSCDANSAYTLDQVEHLRKFNQFHLLMIEQPLWATISTITRACKKNCEQRFAWMVYRQRSKCSLRPGNRRMPHHQHQGGARRRILRGTGNSDLCQADNIPVWCGGMLETGIGRAQNIALSTLADFSLPGDVSASKRYWEEDIIEPEVEVSPQGMIAIRDEPGTGYAIKADLIEQLTVRKETLRP